MKMNPPDEFSKPSSSKAWQVSILSVVGILVSLVFYSCNSQRGSTTEGTTTSQQCVPKVELKQVQDDTRGKSVSIYWDISQSMRTYGMELKTVFDTLDSSILPSAGQTGALRHFSVGSKITELSTNPGGVILNPRDQWTALHDVAYKIGSELSEGNTDAAILVSDMELELPQSILTQAEKTICTTVGLPSTPKAGAVFGRCFESGLQSIRAPDRKPPNGIYITTFKRTKKSGKTFLVTLFSFNADFGQKLSQEMQSKWADFEQSTLIDSIKTFETVNPSCTVNLKNKYRIRAQEQTCNIACDRKKGSIDAACTWNPESTGNNHWLAPAIPTLRSIPAKDNQQYPRTHVQNNKKDYQSVKMSFSCQSREPNKDGQKIANPGGSEPTFDDRQIEVGAQMRFQEWSKGNIPASFQSELTPNVMDFYRSLEEATVNYLKTCDFEMRITMTLDDA
jgi:hypothetical protein